MIKNLIAVVVSCAALLTFVAGLGGTANANASTGDDVCVNVDGVYAVGYGYWLVRPSFY